MSLLKVSVTFSMRLIYATMVGVEIVPRKYSRRKMIGVIGGLKWQSVAAIKKQFMKNDSSRKIF